MNAQGLPHLPPGAPRHCPECGAALATAAPACRNCGLGLVGPTAQRLWWIDTELEALRGRERTLARERPVVLERLREESRERARRAGNEQHGTHGQRAVGIRTAAQQAAPPPGPIAAPARSAGPPAAPEGSGEVSRRSAQNLILGLGGLLVGVAALVFAVWAWSDMSTGTRASVLVLTTLTFAVLALPLYHRGLRATAETFGAVAAGLLFVDALALWLLTDRITNGPGYTAAVLTVVSALLLLYPALVPLRAPRVLAALLLQPVPPLLVVALPTGSHPGWLPVVLAATALTDVLVLRHLGVPRPGVPVRTVKVTALLLWGLTVLGTVVAVLASTRSSGADPTDRWFLAAALFLAGTTALLLERRRRSERPGPERHRPRVVSVYTVMGLGALTPVPLVAGPAHLPVLPRLTVLPWSLEPSAMTVPAVELLQLDRASTLPPLNLVHLAGVLVATTLVLGAVRLLHRSALLVTAALLAPTALLALPLLLGLPQAVVVVWALVLGGGLVVGSALLDRRTGAVPVFSGTLTLLTGVVWALPERYTTLAAVLMLAATALVCAAGARRFANPVRRPEPGDRSATLYSGGALLWGLALLVGCAYLIANRGLEGTAQSQWWLLAAAALLCGATALTLGRVWTPATIRTEARTDRNGRPLPSVTDLRRMFTPVGLLLLATAPLLSLPENSPALTVFSDRAPWSAPVRAMGEPVHVVLGLPAQPGVLLAAGSALGLLLAGSLMLGLVAVIDRPRFPAALALAVPPVLVPLPVLLGAPFVAAVVWTALVGATLFLWASGPRAAATGLPGVTGTATMLLALAWALPQQHTTLLALLLFAAAVTVSALVRRSRCAGAVGTSATSDAPAGFGYGLTAVTWSSALLSGFVALLVTAIGDTPGHVPWWQLSGIALLLGASALVLGRTDRLVASARAEKAQAARARAARPPTPTPGAANVTRSNSGTARVAPTPFSALGLALLALVPLLAGPSGLLAPSAFSPSHAVHEAPLAALLVPAHVFIGVPAPADVLSLFTVPLGLLLLGAAALGAAQLLDRVLLVPVAALVVPLTLVPLPVAAGAPFLAALVWTLAVGALLLTGAALFRTERVSWIPWLTGVCTLALALSWVLPERHSMAGVLLTVAVIASLATALARTRFVAVASTSVATAATGGFALTLPVALDVPVEYAAFGPVAVMAAVAVAAPRLRSPLAEAAEIPAAVWAAIALALTVLYGERLELVAVALAAVGVVTLAGAARPDRRWLAVVGGALMLLALWTALAAWNVTVPEAYTALPAAAFLVVGWEWSRSARDTPSSWLSHGAGLALLLGPTVWQVLLGDDMVWRVPAVLAVGLAVTVWGLGRRLQAALVIGGLALLVTSLRAFGPPLWELTRLTPNWLPFALIGVLLLVVGARYEASLAGLRRIGRLITRTR